MKFTSAQACYICLTVTSVMTMSSVIAFPHVRQETTASLPNRKSYCTSLAVQTILKSRQSHTLGDITGIAPDMPSDLTYLTSGTQNESPYVTSGFEGDYSYERSYDDSRTSRNDDRFEDVFSDLGEKDYASFASDRVISSLVPRVLQLRDQCLARLTQNQDMSEDVSRGQDSLIRDGDQFSDGDFSVALGNSRSQAEPSKRSDLGLNPTGWRKRRSGDHVERYQQFLRHVRRLLEKRKRLEFNPTGW